MTARLIEQRRMLAGLGVEVDMDLLTGIGEYDTYRAGMLMNSRPDGSFMNW